jgi:glutamate formiminotransferase/formiminotetrahydrofolate cyclodeaminase
MVGGEADTPLVSSPVQDFVRAVGARTSAPGGGSASALMASLGAALATMVGWMTYGKRKFEDKDAVMRRLIPPLHQAMETLIPLVDADTRAFADYLEARGLPKETEEQGAHRRAAMEAGLKKAVEVPLTVLRVGDGCWDAMVEMARHGSIASRSDLEVGAKALEAGLWGAYRNVLVNLPEIADEAFQKAAGSEAEAIAQRARQRLEDVLTILAGR